MGSLPAVRRIRSSTWCVATTAPRLWDGHGTHRKWYDREGVKARPRPQPWRRRSPQTAPAARSGLRPYPTAQKTIGGPADGTQRERSTDREVSGAPSTPRVEKRYHDLLSNEEAYIDSERALPVHRVHEGALERAPLHARGRGAQARSVQPHAQDLGRRAYRGVAVALLSWARRSIRSTRRGCSRASRTSSARRRPTWKAPSRRRKATAWASTASIPRTARRSLRLATFWEGKDWRSQAEAVLKEHGARLRHAWR